MIIVALLLACSEAYNDMPQDTGMGEPMRAPLPPSGPVLHERSGACIQGLIMDVDLGTDTPSMLQVEIRYSFGQAEIMQSDPLHRSSPYMAEGADRFESPLYRDGSSLTFTCGYRWETPGPIIDGEPAGSAIGWRVSWMTAR